MNRNRKENESEMDDAEYRLKLKKALKSKWRGFPIKLRKSSTKKLEKLCWIWGININELKQYGKE